MSRGIPQLIFQKIRNHFFQEGTDKTILDLLTIKRYNGGYILRWYRTGEIDENGNTTIIPHWGIRETDKNYIERICGRISQ